MPRPMDRPRTLDKQFDNWRVHGRTMEHLRVYAHFLPTSVHSNTVVELKIEYRRWLGLTRGTSITQKLSTVVILHHFLMETLI